MSSSLNSLKETAFNMHPLQRVWVNLGNTEQWYNIIREANQLYGLRNWRCQSHVKRKLENKWPNDTIRVWFDVPDSNFASWIAVKYSVITRLEANK